MYQNKLTKWLDFCRISELRNLIRYQLYKFHSVSNWLNQHIARYHTYSLLFDGADTWVVLRTNVILKYINEFNSVSKIITDTGQFENGEIERVIENLNEGSIFFDIGANVGIYSISVAKKFSDIHIFAFEPVPNTAQIFKENVIKNNVSSKILLIEEAVTNTDGFVNITMDFHSSNYITICDSKYNCKLVRSTTIDTFVKANKIPKIDLIKIDVEGKENYVLKGAIKSIDTFKPVILVELTEQDNQKFADRANHDYNESIQLLLNLGYKYYIFDDHSNVFHMDCKNDGCFERSYHNYLFYFDKINLKNDKIPKN
ncbi:MAG TPA: hypothetical protein DCX03_01890 [Bacteroidales bacterium]|nr:hypothetical protein [Bacteroidales bacterium]